MKTQAIIPAAGKGARLKDALPKPFVLINQKPIVVFSLKILEESRLVDSVILVAGPKYLSDFRKIAGKYRFKKVKAIIAGGATRRESVRLGLAALDADTQYVLIHDAARPLLTLELIRKSIAAARGRAAAVTAVPVKSTIKTVNAGGIVEKTLERKRVWEVQTPQVFKRNIILRAHQKNKEIDPCDDAVLVERLGKKVKVVMGDYKNIKITTRDDLVLAKVFLDSRKTKT